MYSVLNLLTYLFPFVEKKFLLWSIRKQYECVILLDYSRKCQHTRSNKTVLELEANACSKTVPRKYLKYDPVKTSGYIKADITVAFRQTSRKVCSVSCKFKQAINTHALIVCAAEQTTVETYNGGTIGILESFQ